MLLPLISAAAWWMFLISKVAIASTNSIPDRPDTNRSSAGNSECSECYGIVSKQYPLSMPPLPELDEVRKKRPMNLK